MHTVAAVALNLGGLLAEQGLYGEALAANERAVRELGRLGAQAELAAALVNVANVFVALGDLPAARRALDRLGAGTASHRVPRRRRSPAPPGRSSKAIWPVGPDSSPRRCRSTAVPPPPTPTAGNPRTPPAPWQPQPRPWPVRGRIAEARERLAEAEACARTETEDADSAKARAVIALGASGEVGAELSRDAWSASPGERRAASAARAPGASLPWPSGLAARGGSTEAASRLRAFARRIFEEIEMSTPEHHRAGLPPIPTPDG